MLNSQTSLLMRHRHSISRSLQLSCRVASLSSSSSSPTPQPPSLLRHREESRGPITDAAEVVICGAGVIGCATAFHLTQLGCSSVLLLEQGPEVGCGTTWHSSGVIGQLKSNLTLTRMALETLQSCRQLEEMGFSTSVRQNGSYCFAETKEFVDLLHRSKALADWLGIDAELLSVEQSLANLPANMVNPEGLLTALHVPGDAVADNPRQLASAFLSAAESRGASVRYNTRVRRLRLAADGRVSGVQTSAGFVECGSLLLAGGQWTRQLGRVCPVPVRVPLQSCQHFAFVSSSSGESDDVQHTQATAESATTIDQRRTIATVRFPHSGLYARTMDASSADRICAGHFERQGGEVTFPTGVPASFANELLPENQPRMQQLQQLATSRIPLLREQSVQSRVNGPEAFTPDGLPVLGEAPGVPGCFVAAGMNSLGITLCGGVGKVMAQLMLQSSSEMDISSVTVDRFVQQHTDHPAFLLHRAPEVLADWTKTGPKSCYQSGRQLIVSALHECQQQLGAVFEQTANGYERPVLFDTSFIGASSSSSSSDSSSSITDDPQQLLQNSCSSYRRPVWLPAALAEWRKIQRMKTINNYSSATQIRITAQGSDDLEGFLSAVFHMRRAESGLPNLSGLDEVTVLSQCGRFVELQGKLVKQTEQSAILLAPSSVQTKALQLLRDRVLDETVSITDITINYCLLHLPRACSFGELPRLPSDPFVFADQQDVYVLAQAGNANKIYRVLNQIQGFAPIGHYAAAMSRLSEGRPQLGEDYFGRFTPQQLQHLRKVAVEGVIDPTDAESPWAWGGEPVFAVDEVNGEAATPTEASLLCAGYDPQLQQLVAYCVLPPEMRQKRLLVRIGNGEFNLRVLPPLHTATADLF